MHKATDMYGPLPYLKFGLTNPVPYDSQQAIYESFFKELDHAIDILVKFDQANPSSKALVKFDLIFNSNIPNWIRFANSLKLRLAMRISAVYEDAQKIAEAAVAHPYGVIESNDNNPTMQSNSNLSFTYNNPIHSISSAEGYEEDVMGATMDAYLNGFEDPRRAVFFALSSNGNYRGLRNGHKNGDIFKGDEGLSKPNIQQGTPYIWMTAAEVFFLRAEGALKQWDMKGTPEALYKSGIRASFEQHGVKNVENYLVSTKVPARYPGFKASPSAPAPSGQGTGSEVASGVSVTAVSAVPENKESPKDSDKTAEKAVPVQNTIDLPLQSSLTQRAAPWRIAGEVLRTYIICESEDGSVWLIDKHAAHERMNFDKLKNAQEPPMRQTLLAPIAAELSREDGALLLENLPLLEQFGFACEDFGAGALLVREVPADIDAADTVPTLEEFAERLRTGRSPDEKREALLHTMACKAAIKGGWVSDPAELRVLVDRVQSGEIKYCPHGRPVAVKLTKYELEKMFKRA